MMNKETIYVDIDDEITSIINKVQSSEQKIVALVLPKRATVLQSSINMKLLQRSAQEAKKSLVLITTEASLMPLANMAGIHVADTLQSKPYMPSSPDADTLTAATADAEEVMLPEDDSTIDPKRSVGELADRADTKGISLRGLADNRGSDSTGSNNKDTAKQEEKNAPYKGEDSAEFDVDTDIADDEDAAIVVPEKSTRESKDGKNKKFRVPNFERFRLLIILACIALVLIISGIIAAVVILPKAKVSIKTDTSALNTSFTAEVTTSAQSLSVANGVVPAKSSQTQKTAQQTVSATGQKNEGTKATGSVTLSLENCSQPQVTIPAGTGVTSDNLTFVTQASVTLQSVQIGTTCENSKFPSDSSGSVAVTAINPGDQYNLSARTYQLPSQYANVSAQDTKGMSGGTTKMVTVISQQDIDNAKQKLQSQSSSGALYQLQNILQNDGYYPLPVTLTSSTPKYTTSANVGDAASNVTVTSQVTYTLLGVKKADLTALIDAGAKKQMSAKFQKILQDGVSNAKYKVSSQQSPTDITLSGETQVVVGPELNAKDIKQQIMGLKSEQIQALLGNRPGIKQVNVQLSPFWVSRVPKNMNKITLVLDTPQQNAKS